MTVGSVATSEWGVSGAMWSQKPGPASISCPSAVKRSRPEMTCTTAAWEARCCGELLTGVEAEHGHVDALVAVDHLGHDSARLNVRGGGDVRDDDGRHGFLLMPPTVPDDPPTHPRAFHVRTDRGLSSTLMGCTSPSDASPSASRSQPHAP